MELFRAGRQTSREDRIQQHRFSSTHSLFLSFDSFRKFKQSLSKNMSERNKVTRKKLLTRYRFVIVEDQTHENKFKIKGTMLGAISAAVLLLLFIVAFVFSMIAY